MTRDENQQSEENPGHINDLAEASVTAADLKQAPKILRQNPNNSRVTFVFQGDTAKIICARQKYWADAPMPCRTLLAAARDLKAAVRTPNYGGRP